MPIVAVGPIPAPLATACDALAQQGVTLAPPPHTDTNPLSADSNLVFAVALIYSNA